MEPRKPQSFLPALGAMLVLVTVPGGGAEPGATPVELAREHVRQGRLAQERDRPSEAESHYRRAIEAAEGVSRANLLLARAVDGLADVLRDQGRLDEAEGLYLRSVPLWEELLGPRQPRLAVTLHNLGMLYVEQGKPERAEPLLRRALEIWTSAFGPDSEQARNTDRAYRRLSASGGS